MDKNENSRVIEIEKEIKRKTVKIKLHAFDIGKLLVEAKSELPHGSFKDWIKKSFDFSYQSANNFMNLYGCCFGDREVIKDVSTTILYKISAPKFPAALRTHLLDHPHSLKNTKVADIEQLFEKFKGREVDLKDPLIVKLTGRFESIEKAKVYKDEFRACIKQLQEISSVLKAGAEKIKWPKLPNKSATGAPPGAAKSVEDIIGDMKKMIDSITPRIEIINYDLMNSK